MYQRLMRGQGGTEWMHYPHPGLTKFVSVTLFAFNVVSKNMYGDHVVSLYKFFAVV